MLLCLGTTPAFTRAMTFEHLIMDDVNRAVSVRSSAAGKSINVARVLKALGEEPVATGFVGGDTGQWIRDELSAIGIAHDFVLLPEPTRICVTVIDHKTNTATELVEESTPVASEFWQSLRTKLTALIPPAKVLVLSGSLPPGAPDGFNTECCRIARDAGVSVILDARDKPLIDPLPYLPAWVKPSRAELVSTFGGPMDTDQLLKMGMRWMIESGAGHTAITLGGEGAVASDGKRYVKVAAPRVEVVSPIGSGDSFAAGLAIAVARGLDFEASLRLAVACGAANAMTAQAGHLDPAVVRSLVDRISITPF